MIPPSPGLDAPDANNTKRSATNRFSVFWNDAVPCTVISPSNTASLPNVIKVPLSVIDVSANAVPVHFVIVSELNDAAPETATVAVAPPSYVNAVIPVPSVKSGRLVVP
jgi:hypothetical protein